jgi:hypothetical protein
MTRIAPAGRHPGGRVSSRAAGSAAGRPGQHPGGRVSILAAAGLPSRTASGWTSTRGAGIRSVRQFLDARDRGQRLAVDLVRVEPAQLLGQQVGDVAPLQGNVPVRLAGPG